MPVAIREDFAQAISDVYASAILLAQMSVHLLKIASARQVGDRVMEDQERGDLIDCMRHFNDLARTLDDVVGGYPVADAIAGAH